MELTASFTGDRRSDIAVKNELAEILEQSRQLLIHRIPNHQIVNVEIRVGEEVAQVVCLDEIRKAFAQRRILMHRSASSLTE